MLDEDVNNLVKVGVIHQARFVCFDFPLLTHLERQQLMSVSVYHQYKSTCFMMINVFFKKNHVFNLELRKQTDLFLGCDQ